MRPLGRPRCRYEDNIRMVLRGIGWQVVDWIHLGQAGCCEEDGNRLSSPIKGGEFLD
jgi:hypothetical protein